MKRNVDRLYRIVNQILDFRRIDNDKMKLILRQVDLIGMVREVFDYFTGIAEEKQIHYRFSTNIDELNIYIDVNKIEQVLVNIISNAFKYSDSGGDISVGLPVKRKLSCWKWRITGGEFQKRVWNTCLNASIPVIRLSVQ